MSSYPSPEIIDLIKQLIVKLTNFEETSPVFKHIEGHVTNRIHNADSMVFLNKKDIDRSVSSLVEKFNFHGLPTHASDLQKHYENFLPDTTPKDQRECRLNVMKLLFCMAESPTSKFLVDPEISVRIEPEEDIDWAEYLNEGIERWTPPGDSSDTWSEVTQLDLSSNASGGIEDDPISVEIREPDENLEGRRDIETLRKSVQCRWFLKDRIYQVPESTNVDANIAIHWDDFLEHSVQGLIPIKRSSIITEYRILREILWECFVVHNSFTFNFVRDNLAPRENVTISSVRPIALQVFLNKFLPYIELLQDFRTFEQSLFDPNNSVPDTYRSYNNGLWSFLAPVYEGLVELERDIAEQSSTHTLLTTESRMKSLFEELFLVRDIHKQVVLDFDRNDPMICSTVLLSRLHNGMDHCVSKQELDVYLTLYLGSLFKYMSIVNLWIRNDTLIDVKDEFIVKQVNITPGDTTEGSDSTYRSVFLDNDFDTDSNMGYIPRELSEDGRCDTVFKAIQTEILQIGKNKHFLRLLKKFYYADDNQATLYEEFIDGILNEIASYFGYEIPEEEPSIEEETQYKFPATCPDYCKYATEMDRLENLVDTSDGFLMMAFESFFTVGTPKKVEVKRESLYQKISKMTTTLYPAKQIVDTVLTQILKRYERSGHLVKEILMRDFHMRKHFELLRHLFLFENDIIFPLYRRLLTQIENRKFENDVWLTTYLHDIMIDIYPKLYEKCLVKIQSESLDDPLRACDTVDIVYIASWPINLIVKESQLAMYLASFRLILKIKWALHTLNRLYFNEIEIETDSKTHRLLKSHLRKLEVFRFHLLNQFSNIQHYLLGYRFNKSLKRFESDLDESCNLDTLIVAHADFIDSIHASSRDFVEYQAKGHGFNLLLYIVKKFETMWKNAKATDEKELSRYKTMFVNCRDNLDPIILPRDLTIDN